MTHSIIATFLFLLSISSLASAAEFNTKEKVYNYFSVVIPYPAEAVWAVIRDFPHMPKWNKQFEDLQLFIAEGTKDTLAREMFGKDPHSGEPKRVYEKLNLLDDDEYHFSYSVIPYREDNIHFSPFPANIFGHRADAWVHPITEGNFSGQSFVEWRIQQDGDLAHELESQNSPVNQFLFQSLFVFLTQYLDRNNATKEANFNFRVKASKKQKKVSNFQGEILNEKLDNVLRNAKKVYSKLSEGQVLPTSVDQGLPWPRLGDANPGCQSASNYSGQVVIAPVVLPNGALQTFVGRRDYFVTAESNTKVFKECRFSFLSEIKQLKNEEAGSFCDCVNGFINKVTGLFWN